MVLIPTKILTSLNETELEGILFHEFAHIARRDMLVGLLQRITETAFWWHPLVWLLSHRLAVTREEVCDNYVIQAQGDGVRFARCLLTIAENAGGVTMPDAVLGVIDPPGNFEARVRRLLQKEKTVMTRIDARGRAGVALFAIGLGIAFLGCNVGPDGGRIAKDQVDSIECKVRRVMPEKVGEKPQFLLELEIKHGTTVLQKPTLTVADSDWASIFVGTTSKRVRMAPWPIEETQKIRADVEPKLEEVQTIEEGVLVTARCRNRQDGKIDVDVRAQVIRTGGDRNTIEGEATISDGETRAFHAKQEKDKQGASLDQRGQNTSPQGPEWRPFAALWEVIRREPNVWIDEMTIVDGALAQREHGRLDPKATEKVGYGVSIHGHVGEGGAATLVRLRTALKNDSVLRQWLPIMNVDPDWRITDPQRGEGSGSTFTITMFGSGVR